MKKIKTESAREKASVTAQRIMKEKEEILWRESQIKKAIQEEKKLMFFEKKTAMEVVRLPEWIKKNLEEQ